MPISKKGRTKKNNSFGLRKKEKAKKELREWQERQRANPVSMAGSLMPLVAIKSLLHKNEREGEE